VTVIEIFGVRDNRRAKLGTLRLAEDGSVRLDPGFDPSTARFIRRYRCRDRSGKWLTIQDGEPWLRALPANLHGTILWAEETATEEPATPAPA
jgi:hypothetical protein